MLHQFAHPRAAQLQGLRRLGEAAAFHHPGKGTHCVETVHGRVDLSFIPNNLDAIGRFIQQVPRSSMPTWPQHVAVAAMEIPHDP
ncbi:hypothetical protein GCM10027564_17190 [Luteimonas notoginsengisoli]